MASHETKPASGESHQSPTQSQRLGQEALSDTLGNGLIPDREIEVNREKITGNLDKLPDLVLGQVDRMIGEINAIRAQIESLQPETATHRQELWEAESQFHRQGGRGELTTQVLDNACKAWRTYCSQYNAQKERYKTYTDDRRFRQLPDFESPAVDYKTFILYGIFGFELEEFDQQKEASNCQAPAPKIIDHPDRRYNLVIRPKSKLNPQVQEISLSIPAHSQAELEVVRQAQDYSGSGLLAESESDLAHSSGSFSFGAYILGPDLSHQSPVVKQLLTTASDHMFAEWGWAMGEYAPEYQKINRLKIQILERKLRLDRLERALAAGSFGDTVAALHLIPNLDSGRDWQR